MVGDQEAPVKEGDTLEVNIDGVGGKGDGIARVSGFVIFVPNAQKGSRVKIRMTKVLAKVGFAEVVEKLKRTEKPTEVVVQAAPKAEFKDPEPSVDDSEDFGEDADEDEDYMKVE